MGPIGPPIVTYTRGKDRVIVLSPHPVSALCCGNFDNYVPWSLVLVNPYIHLDIICSSLGYIRSLTRNLESGLTNLPSQVPILLLGREKQCSLKCHAQNHNEPKHRQSIEPAHDLNHVPSSTLYRWTISPLHFWYIQYSGRKCCDSSNPNTCFAGLGPILPLNIGAK